MSDDRLIIVAYDIGDPRRWRRVFKCMHGYGEWLQLSVFQCRLSARWPSSLVNQLVAARAGIGLAVLPCYLGDPEPDLARARPAPLAEQRGELWIVTHRDLRRTARVRAFSMSSRSESALIAI